MKVKQHTFITSISHKGKIKSALLPDYKGSFTFVFNYMHHNDSILILQLQSVCNRQYAVLQNILQFFSLYVC